LTGSTCIDTIAVNAVFTHNKDNDLKLLY